MRNRKWMVVLCGICMAAFLTACGGEEEKPENRPQQSVEEESAEGNTQESTDGEPAEESTQESTDGEPGEAPATVSYEEEHQEYKKEETVVMTSDYTNVTVEIENNEAAAEAIMAEFEKEKQEKQAAVQETADAVMQDEFILEFAVENTISYYEDWGYSNMRNDGRILSFSVYYESYTGGAHGSYAEYGMNFDAKTGERLMIADITENKEAFTEVCTQEMLRQSEKLKAEGVLFDEEVLQSPTLEEMMQNKMEGEDWYFTEDGIRFIFNIYEIAPYVAGEITFDIPYDMLADVLKEEYQPKNA